MSNSAETIANFYHQLALLVEAKMPLPESLSKLGEELGHSQFKSVITNIVTRLKNGEKLTDAIKKHPKYFDEFQIKLLETGEETGNLSETLFELAKMSQYNLEMTSKFKEIILYPLFCLNITVIILFTLALTVVPQFSRVFEEMLDGKSLPESTQFLFSASMFCNNNIPFFIFAFIIMNSIIAYLYLGGIFSHKILNRIMFLIPFSNKVVQPLDSARFCTLWSLFLKQKITTSNAFYLSSNFVESQTLSKSLKKAGTMSESGSSLLECVKQTRLDKLIQLTIENSPEEVLPKEINKLADIYVHKIKAKMKISFMMWQFATYLILFQITGGAIYALFLPLVELVKKLGG